MRNHLQYLYSIFVFVGVIGTAYMMVLGQSSNRVPLKALYSPVLRTEASMMAPGLDKLFKVEKAITTHRLHDDTIKEEEPMGQTPPTQTSTPLPKLPQPTPTP